MLQSSTVCCTVLFNSVFQMRVAPQLPSHACCSALQGVAGCCSVGPCVAVFCHVFKCVVHLPIPKASAPPAAIKCVIQCVAVFCSTLQCVAGQGVVVFCSVLQCFAVCCSVLQCVAVCCSPAYSKMHVPPLLPSPYRHAAPTDLVCV